MRTINGPIVTLEEAERCIEVEREKTRGWRETANRRDQYLQECQAELNDLKALIQGADEAQEAGQLLWTQVEEKGPAWLVLSEASDRSEHATLLEALRKMVRVEGRKMKALQCPRCGQTAEYRFHTRSACTAECGAWVTVEPDEITWDTVR